MLRKVLSKVNSFLSYLAPGQPIVPFRRALVISAGVGLIVFVITALNYAYGAADTPELILMTIFGVTALLIFLFPNSKLYAPLSILESNLLATCVAFVCIYLFSSLALGIVFSILGTILGLYLLGCMHPPALFLSIVLVMLRPDSAVLALSIILVDTLLLSLASHLYRIYLKR